jgi:type II secretory pathway component PulF
MPLFKFKVADSAGKIQEILVEGDDPANATLRVQTRGLIPIDFLGQSEGGGGSAMIGRNRFDVVDFTDRLVPLLAANIQLEKALSIIEETADSEQERELMASFRRGLHEGRKFSALIRDRGRMFPNMYASIVEAGEESGALPQVLQQLHKYLIATREMRSFVISSSIYPFFVLFVCLAVISGLLGIVIPKFGTVIRGMGSEPAASTEFLLWMSNTFRDFWWCIPIAIVLVLLMIIRIRDDENARRRWDDVILRVPLAGRIVLLSNIGRLVRTMSILMKSGVHILDTVSISARVLGNHTLRNSISGLAAELRRGEKLSAALSRSDYIPPLVIRMLAVGEETGNPDEMLERVADRYDHELHERIKRALAWFEPIVIILLGGMVGVIVLLLFGAITDMQRGF